MEIFLKGLAAGFIIAVPLGPVSILCFRRVLTSGGMLGVMTVLGAAAADMLYGLVAALGFTAVTGALLSNRIPLRIVGGLFLLYLGVRMLRAHPTEGMRGGRASHKLSHVFFSSFLLMLANPTILVSFLAVFAAIDLTVRWAGAPEAAWLGIGIFLGSAAWWLVYRLASALVGERLRRDALHLINAGAGLLVCAFGVWQLVAAAMHR